MRCDPDSAFSDHRIPPVLLLKRSLQESTATCLQDKKIKRQFKTASLFSFQYCMSESSYARSTRPDFKQDVHTYIFLEPPSVFTLTDFTFDFHIFGVFL